jgi:MinD-like ATPase involved in chromosome partitioning or flagellar assembly
LLFACWSPKGGSGTTVVTAALGLLLARATPSGALLADLAGDLPTALGLAAGPTGIGLADWLVAGPDVPDDALRRIEVDAGAQLRLLPWRGAAGSGDTLVASERGAALATALAADPRPVVVDCGPAGAGAGLAVAAGATVSLLVIRPCYLALRRALDAPLRPSAVVLVTEEGRSLGRADVEDVLGVPVRAEVRVDPSVARAVDAGLLAGRLPRGLERALRPALEAGGREAA